MTCPCVCHRDLESSCDFMRASGGCSDRAELAEIPPELTERRHHVDMSPLEPTSRCVVCRHRARRDGGMTCWACHDRIGDMLDVDNAGDEDNRHPASIPHTYSRVSPAPGTSSGGRRAPGFAAAAPISVPAVALTDRRSKATTTALATASEHARMLELHGRDPEPGEWLDHEGIPHREQSAAAGSGPPLHAPTVLAGWARLVAEDRDVDVPRVPDTRPRDSDWIGPMTWRQHDLATSPLPADSDVAALAGFLRRHLDWVTRQPWVDELAAELTRARDQLRPAAGERRARPVGRCPNTIDEGDHTRVCGAPLAVPPWSDTVACPSPACRRTWTRDEWLRLGDLLDAGGP